MDIKGKKVLIVEDDKFFISLISKKLKEAELDVSFANNGKEAFEELAKGNPDLILLDIMLPDIDGYEILKRIRDNNVTKNIPVVFLSNLGSKDDILKGRELGVNSFLIKATVTIEDVLNEVSRIILAKEAAK
jgi:CheY-like chemotaxis protein